MDYTKSTIGLFQSFFVTVKISQVKRAELKAIKLLILVEKMRRQYMNLNEATFNISDPVFAASRPLGECKLFQILFMGMK